MEESSVTVFKYCLQILSSNTKKDKTSKTDDVLTEHGGLLHCGGQSTSRSYTDYLPANFASKNSILLKFLSSLSLLF